MQSIIGSAMKFGTPLSPTALRVMIALERPHLAVPESDLRLFGKPEAFPRRRMGVAIANGSDVEEARQRAKLAASRVKPVAC